MRMLAGALGLITLLAVGCSSSHSNGARREAHLACSALFGEVGPMLPTMHDVMTHLTKAAALDHGAYAPWLANARELRTDLKAGLLPNSRVHAAPLIDEMSRNCRTVA